MRRRIAAVAALVLATATAAALLTGCGRLAEQPPSEPTPPAAATPSTAPPASGTSLDDANRLLDQADQAASDADADTRQGQTAEHTGDEP